MRASARSAKAKSAPKIVVYQSTNREGSTFELSPDEEQMLEDRFGDKLHPAPRVFVAHAIRGDGERLHGRLAKQLVMLLTGLDDESLSQAGEIEFRDPVTERRL
jgi:hypothetical protein